MEKATCKICGEEKSTNEFCKDNRSITGIVLTCLQCHNARRNKEKEYEYNKQWRKNNPDKIKAAKAREFQKHKERYNESNRKWRAKNKDKVKQYYKNYEESKPENIKSSRKKYRDANKEYFKEKNREYKQSHKDNVRDWCENRRAQIINKLVGKVNRVEIFARDKGICHICRKSVDENNWHLDHILPLKHGGSHSQYNVMVSHPECNMKKGTNIVEYWIDWT